MVAILAPNQYDQWLDAEPDQMMAFLLCWPADELVAAVAVPLVRRIEAPTSPQRVLF